MKVLQAILCASVALATLATLAAGSTGPAVADEYNDGQSVNYYNTLKGKKVVLLVISLVPIVIYLSRTFRTKE